MIYALQSLDGGAVKIGTTENLDARIIQLESRYGRPLALLATLPGGAIEERAIHRRFAHIRIKGSPGAGAWPEQFRPTAELMAFLGLPLLVGANPDAVEAMPVNPRLRLSVTNIRATPEWKEWLVRFAVHTRKDQADVVDEALLRYARAEGFELPPKR